MPRRNATVRTGGAAAGRWRRRPGPAPAWRQGGC